MSFGAGMTEWELNTQMGLSRAKLFTELKSAFGENALKGWKPPIPGDDIKGGIQQMARYYVENSNTVYLAPFIGDEAERRMFSGTLSCDGRSEPNTRLGSARLALGRHFHIVHSGVLPREDN